MPNKTLNDDRPPLVYSGSASRAQKKHPSMASIDGCVFDSRVLVSDEPNRSTLGRRLSVPQLGRIVVPQKTCSDFGL